MGKIHTRLGRVEANPELFVGGGPDGPGGGPVMGGGEAGGPGGAARDLFDADFTPGGM
jgi:hypothetical protein